MTFSNWKRQFLEHGAAIFGGNRDSKQYERRIAELERVLGQKEVELALLKGFFGGSLTVDQRVALVNRHRRRYWLNTCLGALGLSRGNMECILTGAPGPLMDLCDARLEHGIGTVTTRPRAFHPGIVATGRNLQDAAHRQHRKLGIVRFHELVDGPDPESASRAK